MSHLNTISRRQVVVAKAESLLVKQAQIEVIAQAVAVLGDAAALVKGDGGGEEE
jgi:hypothetical protein